MEKKTTGSKKMENTNHATNQSLGLNQIEGSSEYIIAELKSSKAWFIQALNKQDTENTMHSEPARNAETTVRQSIWVGRHRSVPTSLCVG